MPIPYEKLLKDFCCTPDFGEYWDLTNLQASSQEGFNFLINEYCSLIERRINFCLSLLPKYKTDPLLNFTLASLYDLSHLDESDESLKKIKTRYYCLKTIRLDSTHGKAWHLLSECYRWLAFLESPFERQIEKKEADIKEKADRLNRSVIRYLENALFCLKKAIQLEPDNTVYKNTLLYLYELRNAEYGSSLTKRHF